MLRAIANTVFAALLTGSATGALLAAPVNFLDIGNRLVTVDSAAPGTITSTIALTGIQGNETLLGFDYRPASPRILYGLSSAGRLYAINPRNGSATALAAAGISGFAAGVDFNPVVDRLRVVTNTANNYRINPDTGLLAATDAQIAYAPGDAGAGIAPRPAGAAYTNNFAGATSTTLYVIDTNRGVLAVQGSAGGTPVSPNTGQLTTVGSLGVATNDNVGFDIARDGTVLASLTQPGTGTGTTSLYSVNLATGAATLIGVVGAGGKTYLGLAIAPAAVASYGTTANQIAVGGALDNFTGLPSAGLNGVFNSLDGLASGDRGAALSQLTPAAYSLLPELTLRTADFEANTIQRYLRDFRDGATGGRVSGNGNVGSFLVASGRTGRYDAATERARVDYGGAGVMAGLDYRFGDTLLVGITGGYDEAEVRLGANVRNSEIRNYFGGAYATLRYSIGYIDVFGSYGEADYDLRRAARFGATSLDFAANTHSKSYVGGGTIGVKLAFGGAVLEPYAGVRYAKVKLRGFTDGSGIDGLTLFPNNYESVLGNFGAKLGGAFEVAGATVRPEVRAAYRHEFNCDGSRSFTYGFDGTGATTVLAFSPTALRRSYATAGAGLTVSGPHSPLSLVIDYDGDFAKDRQINGITGGLRYVF